MSSRFGMEMRNQTSSSDMLRRDFYHKTFGCFDDTPQCLDTIFCWPCQVGHQYAAVQGHTDTMLCGPCFLAAIACPITFFAMPMHLRCLVSEKYDLDEGCFHSSACGCFCAPCSLCLTGRELNYRGTNPRGCLFRSQDNTAGTGQGGDGGTQKEGIYKQRVGAHGMRGIYY